MTSLAVPNVKELLEGFRFAELFVEELGWNNPASHTPIPFTASGRTEEANPIAELAGVVALEITLDPIPDANQRKLIHREIRRARAEHVLIFVDPHRTRSCWSWVKLENKKEHLRDHFYFKGEPGDGFISKIANLAVDLSELDLNGKLDLVRAAAKVKSALDVQRVVKLFYGSYKDVKDKFVLAIEGIDDPADRAWYASVILNRLMFVYFLQKGRFLDRQNLNYLEEKLAQYGDAFYETFLNALFFEAFAKPIPSAEAKRLCGEIPYLNGGLFLPHRLETKYAGKISIPLSAFREVFELFGDYSWTFNDVPGDPDKEINPDVLGYIFEKYINQKEFGAYYTPSEITDYLCHQTIHRLILDKMADQGYKTHDSVGDMLLNLKGDGVLFLLKDVLPSISLLDPACGSGAFLFAALRTLLVVYTAGIERIDDLNHEGLQAWRDAEFKGHRSRSYTLKKKIITDNLYGVDIMEEAVEIAKLRLFMALVSSVNEPGELEPLPNIDFNLLPGNSLIGLMRVEDESFDKRRHTTASLFGTGLGYAELVHAKNIATGEYRHPQSGSDARQLRDDIDKLDAEAMPLLNGMLLDAFKAQRVVFEEATWDATAHKEGKPKKRELTADDLEALEPFHWAYQFNERFAQGRGFDAIITNPPWEVLQSDEKEFFHLRFDQTIQKNVIRIEDWIKRKDELLQDGEMRSAWLEYLSRFPHQGAYFKSAPEYESLRVMIDGKRVATKINLYYLFTERCYHLLRPGGLMGIVIPSGFYTDQGAAGLRRLFFDQAEITGLFGFENRKEVFEGVHRSFKFIVLSARKAGHTVSFPAAFMRTDVKDLQDFPRSVGLPISVEMIKRMSPDSWSLMEFKSEMDIQIAEKMLRFPRLGEKIEGTWNLKLTQEFNMTLDSHLFKTTPAPGRLPLYEGKCFHQYRCDMAKPKYWIEGAAARVDLLTTKLRGAGIKLESQTYPETARRWIRKPSIVLDYETPRIAFRDVARNTDERTMIATVLPPNVFCPHTVSLEMTHDLVWRDGGVATVDRLDEHSRLLLLATLNSFIYDWVMRFSITTHMSFFFVYTSPVPRHGGKYHNSIVTRSAKLVSIGPEFDALARSVGLRGHEDGATDPSERAKLRAEIDGIVAHLYGLTEEEFKHVLTTFPLVKQEIKDAALASYSDVERGVIK